MQPKQLKIQHFATFSAEDLRENRTQHMIADLIICVNGGIALHSWVEDTQDEPSAYSDYTTDDLKTFLLVLKLEY